MTSDIYDRNSVIGLFDRMSRSYERMNIILSFGFSTLWRRQAAQMLHSNKTAPDVLDAMSGMGETWAEIYRRFPKAKVSSLDFSPAMVAHSKTRNEKRFASQVTVHCDDMLESRLPDASFDALLSAYGLKTFNEEQSAVLATEVARLLRPGASFAFIEVTEPPNPVLRALYLFYLRTVVPAVGLLCITDPTEYRMLHRYLHNYGDGSYSVAAFEANPLLETHSKSHFFGCARSVYGTRVTAE
ncbi:class I SAM-dependent methyltransferase [Leucobacter sp. UT-8R-CII-1-4]|uniref:class I SAM-dependent methyltransferase n=1 Tax=Leucobacter sp. UT-8R-CII-1-4 TaxID=3040075 RepID=UPI0024A96DA8|nr:class I SAM-dependent methyltransferase [Leucobacter sp. UT-8R-CII-1-4]MDI6024315.1 class I SAM-dependent methyltransferase [Leucobacter sp. UT-8R-CII-1-4]